MLLLSSPPLDLALSIDCCQDAFEFLGINENDRKPARSVRATFPGLMVFNPTGEIRCCTNIEGVVSAAKKVDPSHQTTMPSSSVESKH